MVVITKKRGETKDAIFRKFTKTVIEENIVDDVRKRQFYKKPSLVRQEKEKDRRRGIARKRIYRNIRAKKHG